MTGKVWFVELRIFELLKSQTEFDPELSRGRGLIGLPSDQEEDFVFICSYRNTNPTTTTTRPPKMADSAAVKTSWADDVEVELEPPKVEDYVDENGIRITVEYTVNDEGKKVKV